MSPSSSMSILAKCMNTQISNPDVMLYPCRTLHNQSQLIDNTSPDLPSVHCTRMVVVKEDAMNTRSNRRRMRRWESRSPRCCRWPLAPEASPARVRRSRQRGVGHRPRQVHRHDREREPGARRAAHRPLRGRVRSRERSTPARAPEGRPGRHRPEGDPARQPGRAARPTRSQAQRSSAPTATSTPPASSAISRPPSRSRTRGTTCCPAAASTVEQVYGGMYSMPYQYNIEGIFYNKEILADNGIEEPETWDDLAGRRRRRSRTPASRR